MNIQSLKTKLSVVHQDVPQRAWQATSALDEIQHGIDELAKLGHNYILSEGEASKPIEYPKMLYRDDSPELIVESEQEELQALKDGYRSAPLEEEGFGLGSAEPSSSLASPDNEPDVSLTKEPV